MPQEIIDLDAVAGPPKQVRLDGKVYKLPPDIPVELYLQLVQAEKQTKAAAGTDGAGEDHDIEVLYEHVLGLFQWGDPKITKLPIGLVQLIQAIPTIYGQKDTQEPPAGPPRKPAARGTRSTPAKRKPATRSRSSRS